MKSKVRYIQLYNIQSPGNVPTDQQPYNKYTYEGGAITSTNQGIQYYIPPTAYEGLDPNKDLEIELILGFSTKGIQFNLGFYTVEFDFGFINQKSTTNSKYQTMFVKMPNITPDERYSQEIRQKVRITGHPQVIKTRFKINGIEDMSNLSPQLYLFKITEV